MINRKSPSGEKIPTPKNSRSLEHNVDRVLLSKRCEDIAIERRGGRKNDDDQSFCRRMLITLSSFDGNRNYEEEYWIPQLYASIADILVVLAV